MGGTIGIVFGVSSSLAVSQGLGWPIRIPVYAIAVSTLFAATVALFFGFYPASRASQLNPIEALRYE
jgi:ABC-type antimicrobial peptide transport system permease subunit